MSDVIKNISSDTIEERREKVDIYCKEASLAIKNSMKFINNTKRIDLLFNFKEKDWENILNETKNYLISNRKLQIDLSKIKEREIYIKYICYFIDNNKKGGGKTKLVISIEEKINKLIEKHLSVNALCDYVIVISKYNELHSLPYVQTSYDSIKNNLKHSIDYKNESYKNIRSFFRKKEYSYISQICRKKIKHSLAIIRKKLLPDLSEVERLRGEDAAKWGKLSIKISNEIREFLVQISIFRKLEFYSLWINDEESVFFEKTSKLKLKSLIKIPRSYSIKNINNNFDNYIDKNISIFGKVSSIDIKNTDGKSVSYISIESFKSSDTITAELHGIRIDTGGISVGSAINLGGRLKVSSSGEKMFLVGRFPLKQYAKESWVDSLSWFVINIYQNTPHQIMANWSLSTGMDGAINPVRYNQLSKNR